MMWLAVRKPGVGQLSRLTMESTAPGKLAGRELATLPRDGSLVVSGKTTIGQGYTTAKAKQRLRSDTAARLHTFLTTATDLETTLVRRA